MDKKTVVLRVRGNDGVAFFTDHPLSVSDFAKLIQASGKPLEEYEYESEGVLFTGTLMEVNANIPEEAFNILRTSILRSTLVDYTNFDVHENFYWVEVVDC